MPWMHTAASGKHKGDLVRCTAKENCTLDGRNWTDKELKEYEAKLQKKPNNATQFSTVKKTVEAPKERKLTTKEIAAAQKYVDEILKDSPVPHSNVAFDAVPGQDRVVAWVEINKENSDVFKDGLTIPEPAYRLRGDVEKRKLNKYLETIPDNDKYIVFPEVADYPYSRDTKIVWPKDLEVDAVRKSKIDASINDIAAESPYKVAKAYVIPLKNDHFTVDLVLDISEEDDFDDYEIIDDKHFNQRGQYAINKTHELLRNKHNLLNARVTYLPYPYELDGNLEQQTSEKLQQFMAPRVAAYNSLKTTEALEEQTEEIEKHQRELASVKRDHENAARNVHNEKHNIAVINKIMSSRDYQKLNQAEKDKLNTSLEKTKARLQRAEEKFFELDTARNKLENQVHNLMSDGYNPEEAPLFEDDTCMTCLGEGQIQSKEYTDVYYTCERCNGSGVIR